MNARFYVYALIDPRCGRPFYIGKGCKQRVKQHVLAANKGTDRNVRKLARIREIHASGNLVVESILHRNLSEQEALRIERGLLKSMRNLTNIAPGVMSHAERSSLHAQFLLSQTKRFSQWMETGSPQPLKDAAKFYARFVGALLQEMILPSPLVVESRLR